MEDAGVGHVAHAVPEAHEGALRLVLLGEEDAPAGVAEGGIEAADAPERLDAERDVRSVDRFFIRIEVASRVGCGSTFTVTSVIAASVPQEPANTLQRS